MSSTLKIVLLRALQVATAAGAAGVCLAVLAPLVVGRSDGYGRVPSAQADLKSMATALDLYQADLGKYPEDAEGLTPLLMKPRDPAWKGPYLDTRDLPRDPWGHDYRYHGRDGGKAFELICLGPDGLADTNDDLKELRRHP